LNPEKAFGEVISQEKLAEIADLDRTFISLMERGKRQPSLSSILVLAKALEIPAAKLVQLVQKKMKP